MWQIRSEEPAAEAKNAEGASWTALRIPRPPNYTGREACVHYHRNVCRNSTHDGSQRFIVCLEAGGEEITEVVQELRG